MEFLFAQGWLGALTFSLMPGFLGYVLVGERNRRRKLEHHLKHILRTRYTHPEELAEALSEAEIEFPRLAPAGLIGVTNNKGDFVLRQDATIGLPRRGGGYQPEHGKMPPPPPPGPRTASILTEPCRWTPPTAPKPEPDQDDKTIESCRARFPQTHVVYNFGGSPEKISATIKQVLDRGAPAKP